MKEYGEAQVIWNLLADLQIKLEKNENQKVDRKR